MKLSQALATLLSTYSFIGVHMVEAQSNEHVPRLVGYQQGRHDKDCLDFTNSKYTHIIVGFAVTYEGWDGCEKEPNAKPDCYSCSSSCKLLPVPRNLCKGLQLMRDDSDMTNLQAVRDQISKWRGNNERKVMISIGGAGQDKCWSTKTTACKDNQKTLAKELAKLVTDYGFDGVDIDYEVNPANAPDSEHGQEDLVFLKDFTKSLRSALTAEKLISHTPRDDAMQKKAGYFKSLQDDAEYRNSITWIQPQFYNGMRHVVSNGQVNIHTGIADNDESAKTIFSNLINLFGANRVGFGFCLKECTDTATSAQAISVIQQIKEAAKICAIGGVFAWELANDGIEGASWGNSVADEALKSSCDGPVTPAPTTVAPVAPKTAAPKASASSPMVSPVVTVPMAPKTAAPKASASSPMVSPTVKVPMAPKTAAPKASASSPMVSPTVKVPMAPKTAAPKASASSPMVSPTVKVPMAPKTAAPKASASSPMVSPTVKVPMAPKTAAPKASASSPMDSPKVMVPPAPIRVVKKSKSKAKQSKSNSAKVSQKKASEESLFDTVNRIPNKVKKSEASGTTNSSGIHN